MISNEITNVLNSFIVVNGRYPVTGNLVEHRGILSFVVNDTAPKGGGMRVFKKNVSSLLEDFKAAAGFLLHQMNDIEAAGTGTFKIGGLSIETRNNKLTSVKASIPTMSIGAHTISLGSQEQKLETYSSVYNRIMAFIDFFDFCSVVFTEAGSDHSDLIDYCKSLEYKPKMKMFGYDCQILLYHAWVAVKAVRDPALSNVKIGNRHTYLNFTNFDGEITALREAVDYLEISNNPVGVFRMANHGFISVKEFNKGFNKEVYSISIYLDVYHSVNSVSGIQFSGLTRDELFKFFRNLKQALVVNK